MTARCRRGRWGGAGARVPTLPTRLAGDWEANASGCEQRPPAGDGPAPGGESTPQGQGRPTYVGSHQPAPSSSNRAGVGAPPSLCPYYVRHGPLPPAPTPAFSTSNFGLASAHPMTRLIFFSRVPRLSSTATTHRDQLTSAIRPAASPIPSIPLAFALPFLRIPPSRGTAVGLSSLLSLLSPPACAHPSLLCACACVRHACT